MEKKLCYIFFCLYLHIYGQKENIFSQIDIPNGYYRAYYADSIIKIINDKPYEGVDSFYFVNENERLLAIESYVNGHKTRIQTFYDNGKPERLYEFKRGKRHGLSQGWYKSGKILFDDIKENGKDVGMVISYYENGNIQWFSDERIGISMEFYENGKTARLSKKIVDSVNCPNGEGRDLTYWYENGQLQEKIIVNCGKQRLTFYANDSIKLTDATIIGMELYYVGKIREYHLNGKLKMEGQFEEDGKPNIKTGEWHYWDEKGRLEKTEFYEKNKMIKTDIFRKEKLKKE